MIRKVENRAGTYRRVYPGTKEEYRAFVPADLPPVPELMMDDEMMGLLVDATAAIRTLEGITDLIPDMDLFVSMFVRKEALTSSQIEGTQATLEDILNPALDISANADLEEVVNYVRALNYGMQRLERLPLSIRFMKEVHRELMTGARGQNKAPGEFRKSQNWLGSPGSRLQTASYVPPCVEDMKAGMNALEKYMNDISAGYPLVAAGLMHYQLESIHPFLDGNGRLGRMLIVLYLMETGMLSKPAIYPSYYLKQNQAEYYDRLALVRKAGSYEQWIKFFLECICQSAEDSIKKTKELNCLCTRGRELAAKAGKGPQKLYEYLLGHPIIDVGITARELGVSYNTAQAYIEKLRAAGLLQLQNEERAPKRNRSYAYGEYIDILKA